MKKQFSAMGFYIFMGSATLGVENNGFDIKRILEISDDIKEANAASFIENRPNIPVVLPKEWRKKDYLESLEEVDLLYSNCPCSGLSQLNRNAAVDNATNNHIYDLAETVKTIKPKVFLLENAPTLIGLGMPILQKVVNELKDDYKFTIIRDAGMNHEVCMQRLRTFVIGWRKDVFEKVPILEMNKKEKLTMLDVIGKYKNIEFGDIDAHVLDDGREDKDVEHLYNIVEEGKSINVCLCEQWDEIIDELEEKKIKSLMGLKNKIDNGRRFFDKSHFKPKKDGLSPSMASTTKIIHPILNRPLTIREYMSIMGYPEDYKYIHSNIPPTQAIGQGVPVKFFEYISGQVKKSLNNEINEFIDCDIVFQHHNAEKAQVYTLDEFMRLDKLEIVKDKEIIKLVK